MIKKTILFIFLLSNFAQAAFYFGVGGGVDQIQFSSNQSFQSGNYKGSKAFTEALLQTKILPFVSGFDLFGGLKYLNANNIESTLSEKIYMWSSYYGADLTFSVFYLGFAFTQNHMKLKVGGTNISQKFNAPEIRTGLKVNLTPKFLLLLGVDFDFTKFSIPIELNNIDMQFRDLTGVGKIYFAI